ncbi:MAG: hypothetical protein UY04_C0007G0006 [Parcubacteria group bacterium GW2011_GWA2_47_7]|nr:MAG: hypothetical protein UY04_C0007G0006 [Parcubacteria group bacterium GW2011_GWA2_47_7]
MVWIKDVPIFAVLGYPSYIGFPLHWRVEINGETKSPLLRRGFLYISFSQTEKLFSEFFCFSLLQKQLSSFGGFSVESRTTCRVVRDAGGYL